MVSENRCLYELAPLEIMLLLRGAMEVVTPKPTSIPLVGEAMGQVVRHPHADVLIDGNQIVEVGQNLDPSNSKVIDVSGKVIVPGFVDPHTHLVWSGSREHELEWKLKGRTYQEILADGGGILRTVGETRKASKEDLQEESLVRLKNAVRHGTTTIEIKSGYGLEKETEIKQLKVANWLGTLGLADTVVTYMGAHAIPDDMDRYTYVASVLKNLEELQKIVKYWCTDDENKNILYKKSGEERYPNFKLYKMIARTVHKHTPEAQLKNNIFKKFQINKLDVDNCNLEMLIDIDNIPSYI